MNLTFLERNQIKFLLPMKGDLQTLELVEKILDKTVKDKNEEEIEIYFDIKEIEFLKSMISILDKCQNLNFQSLSLIKKILRS